LFYRRNHSSTGASSQYANITDYPRELYDGARVRMLRDVELSGIMTLPVLAAMSVPASRDEVGAASFLLLYSGSVLVFQA